MVLPWNPPFENSIFVSQKGKKRGEKIDRRTFESDKSPLLVRVRIVGASPQSRKLQRRFIGLSSRIRKENTIKRWCHLEKKKSKKSGKKNQKKSKKNREKI